MKPRHSESGHIDDDGNNLGYTPTSRNEFVLDTFDVRTSFTSERSIGEKRTKGTGERRHTSVNQRIKVLME